MNAVTTTTNTGKVVRVTTVNDALRAMHLSSVHRIDAEVKRLQAERAAAVQALRDLTGGKNGKHVVPGVGSITFSENNTYNQQSMLDALKPGQFMRCSERRLVNARVRELYPAIYEAAKENRGYKASVERH